MVQSWLDVPPSSPTPCRYQRRPAAGDGVILGFADEREIVAGVAQLARTFDLLRPPGVTRRRR